MGTYTGGTKLYKPDVGEGGWGTLVSTNFDRLSEPETNVKSHGALCDGTTNDSAAITAAVTALPSTGGVVLIPGVSKVTTGITDGGKPVVFRGTGQTVSGLVGTGITILTLTANGSRVEDLTIKDSNPVNDTNTIGIDINNGATGVTNWTLRRVSVLGRNGDGLTSILGIGVRMIFALRGAITDCSIESWNVGLSYQRQGAGGNKSNANEVSGCKIRVCSTGVDIPANGADDVFIRGSTIEGNSVVGLNCDATCLVNLNSNHFENVYLGTAKINLQMSTGWLRSVNNGYYGAVANSDIKITGSNYRCLSDGDLLNAGITHSGTGRFDVRSPALVSLSVAGTGPVWTDPAGFDLTYGATVTPDPRSGTVGTVVATNATAFTIASPSGAANSTLTGRPLTIGVFNNTAGAMGAITWGAKFALAGAFTNPAAGKRRTITFAYEGNYDIWIETSRAAADI